MNPILLALFVLYCTGCAAVNIPGKPVLVTCPEIDPVEFMVVQTPSGEQGVLGMLDDVRRIFTDVENREACRDERESTLMEYIEKLEKR